MKNTLTILIVLLALFCLKPLHAENPGRIPDSFLGKWKSTAKVGVTPEPENTETTGRRRYQKRGMIEISKAFSGKNYRVFYSANGNVSGRTSYVFNIEGIGSVPSDIAIKGRWFYKNAVLTANLIFTVYLPDYDKDIRLRGVIRERLVGEQIVTTGRINGESIEASFESKTTGLD